MQDWSVEAFEERRHEPGDDPCWEESWSIDAIDADGTTLHTRLTLRPADRVAWYWAYLVEPGEGVLVVRNTEVPLPRGSRTLEIRGDGLWADTICEAPFEHWSFGLEAFAVLLDDALDAFAGERGERMPFGLDVEWEQAAPPLHTVGGYEQLGTMSGDVLVAARRRALDARALRTHRFGPNNWSATPRVAVSSVDLVGAVCIPLRAGLGIVHRTFGGDGGPFGADIVVEP